MQTLTVTVYSKDNCPNCVAAKALLKQKNLEFAEFDVQQPGVLVNLLSRYPEARQMPQIFFNGQRLGGLEGLKAALKQLDL